MTTSRIVEPQYQAAPQRTETVRQKAPVEVGVSRPQAELDSQMRPPNLNYQPGPVHVQRHPEPVHVQRHPEPVHVQRHPEPVHVQRHPEPVHVQRHPEHWAPEPTYVHRSPDSSHQHLAKDHEYLSHPQTHETRPTPVRQSEYIQREPTAIASGLATNTSTLRQSSPSRRAPPAITSNLTPHRSLSHIMPTLHPLPEPSDAVSYDYGKPVRPISPIHPLTKPAPHTTNSRQKSIEMRNSNPLGPRRGHSVGKNQNLVRSGPGNVTFGESHKNGVQGGYVMQEGDKVVEMRRGESRVVSE
jgi:hypothetical protein